MSIVNAHIKNVNYEFVEIVLRDEFTGAIIGNKIIFEQPSALSLQSAQTWVAENYSTDNINVTTEGFEQPLPSKSINEEGVIYQKEQPIINDWPSFSEYLTDQNLPIESKPQVETAVNSYLNQLSDSNICLPPRSTEEIEMYSGEQIASYPMQDEDKIQSLPEDDQTITSSRIHNHETESKYTPDDYGDHDVMSYEPGDVFDNNHKKFFDGIRASEGLDARTGEVGNPPNVPKFKKSAINTDLLSSTKKETTRAKTPNEIKKSIDKKGIGGDVLDEPVPAFDNAKYDIVMNNKNNAFITLTRDRNTNLMSGYGGKGNHGAGAIDIVCGRMGNEPRQTDDENKEIRVNPFFVPTKTNLGTVVDSARVYISQKADIDDYFQICEGRVGYSKERSAIAIKSDAVRVIGNEGIKLVTKTDSINSKGGRIKKNRGVDIIANNDDSKLQPMVLGDNVQSCLNEMSTMIDNLVGALQATINNVAQLDVALASHIHISPFYGAPTLPSPNGSPMCIASLVELVAVESFSNAAQKWNINTFKWKYLKQGSPMTIRSKYNNVN